jgi:hypothetical protein
MSCLKRLAFFLSLSRGFDLIKISPKIHRRRVFLDYHTRQSIQDPFRSSNRASLHPVTINLISDVLRLRSQGDPLFTNVTTPLDLAVGVSRMAYEALRTRSELSTVDGMALETEEQQTIAGRVVGVAMRLVPLEKDLEHFCESVGWVAKYKEWDRFGACPADANRIMETERKLASDGLFRLNRAECLLALFLHQVEKPELRKKAVSVPDNSIIDFLDTERLEVLNITVS